jgi:hypothetical protein
MPRAVALYRLYQISDGPLEVQVGFNLVNITDVNEKEETIDFDGQLPVDEIIENGFYIQTAFFPVPKKLELYAATSQIYGDSDAILTTVPNT